MLRAPILALALLLAPAAIAQSPARVIDGDTIVVGVEHIRIMGLDAPEIHGRCPYEVRLAARARQRMRQLVANGVWLTTHGRDRYRRTLAIVRDSQGRDVAQVMIAEGLARSYDGRTRRQSWCNLP